jgi:cytidylate kinase
MIITIDGPTASGKSSVARQLADTLSLYYLYTGLLYRGLAYLLAEKYGYDEDACKRPDIAHITAILCAGNFHYAYDKRYGAQIWYGSTCITPYLKTSMVDGLASVISRHAAVRNELVKLQNAIAERHDCIVDGRDCGTVVFPHAQYKFFLQADARSRAGRWCRDQQRQGYTYTIDEACELLSKRDTRDQERDISPLKPADDAICIDNSDATLEQTVERFFTYLPY